MLRRLHELAEQRESFAFETTLAARSYARWIKQLRGRGYEIHLLFVWLRSAELAIERVAERVRRGGHMISSQEVRRRYERGLKNLFELYVPLVDMWVIYDNSKGGSPSKVATGNAEGPTEIARADIWQKLSGN